MKPVCKEVWTRLPLRRRWTHSCWVFLYIHNLLSTIGFKMLNRCFKLFIKIPPPIHNTGLSLVVQCIVTLNFRVENLFGVFPECLQCSPTHKICYTHVLLMLSNQGHFTPKLTGMLVFCVVVLLYLGSSEVHLEYRMFCVHTRAFDIKQVNQETSQTIDVMVLCRIISQMLNWNPE